MGPCALVGSLGEKASQMLVKGQARFLGGAGRIRVDGAEELLDFL